MTRNSLLFSLWTTLFFLLAGCSEIPENNDPVIGIWAKTEEAISESGKSIVRAEWYFNDAYLGRYHLYEGATLVLKTDFKWKQLGGVYTIEYLGLGLEADKASIETNEGSMILETPLGEVLAQRE